MKNETKKVGVGKKETTIQMSQNKVESQNRRMQDELKNAVLVENPILVSIVRFRIPECNEKKGPKQIGSELDAKEFTCLFPPKFYLNAKNSKSGRQCNDIYPDGWGEYHDGPYGDYGDQYSDNL